MSSILRITHFYLSIGGLILDKANFGSGAINIYVNKTNKTKHLRKIKVRMRNLNLDFCNRCIACFSIYFTTITCENEDSVSAKSKNGKSIGLVQ